MLIIAWQTREGEARIQKEASSERKKERKTRKENHQGTRSKSMRTRVQSGSALAADAPHETQATEKELPSSASAADCLVCQRDKRRVMYVCVCVCVTVERASEQFLQCFQAQEVQHTHTHTQRDLRIGRRDRERVKAFM